MTVLLEKKSGKDDICGGRFAAILDIYDKACLRDNSIEDPCESVDDICCPQRGCAQDFDSCPDAVCNEPELQTCGPICISTDGTCCPQGHDKHSCPHVCCPNGFECKTSIDDCTPPEPETCNCGDADCPVSIPGGVICEDSEATCNDGEDNDADGATDCIDPDCASYPSC